MAEADGFDRTVIASPPFSCGLGYLIEILLRLDIRVDFPGKDYWEPEGDGFRLTDAGLAHLSLHARIVETTRRFRFADRRAALVEHRLDLLRHMPARRRAVLLLRDPVDAAWSWYRRWEIGAEGMAFEEYLRRPGYFRWHLPYRAFQAPPLAVFALFVRFWQLAAEELLTLRFEDLKADPVGGTARLLDCMGTARPADAIAAAAGHGSFASLRSGAAAAAWAQVNRRSQVEEWRDRMTEAAHHALLDGPLMRGVAAEHGYRPAEAMPDPFRSDRPAWRMLAEICGRLLAENGGGQADPVQVASVVQDALRGQILGLLNIRIHNGASFDPEHTDALVGAMAALDLLREVFADRAPQPLSRLCRLLTGLAAVLAQGAALPEMRHAVQPLHVVPYAQGRL